MAVAELYLNKPKWKSLLHRSISGKLAPFYSNAEGDDFLSFCIPMEVITNKSVQQLVVETYFGYVNNLSGVLCFL